jgi:hypothetical protein
MGSSDRGDKVHGEREIEVPPSSPPKRSLWSTWSRTVPLRTLPLATPNSRSMERTLRPERRTMLSSRLGIAWHPVCLSGPAGRGKRRAAPLGGWGGSAAKRVAPIPARTYSSPEDGEELSELGEEAGAGFGALGGGAGGS